MRTRLLTFIALLLAAYGAWAQPTISYQSFEGTAQEFPYTSNTFDGRTQTPALTTQYFLREDDPVTGFGFGSPPAQITGEDGASFWAAEGVCGPTDPNNTHIRPARFVQLDNVDVTNKSGLAVKILFADPRGAGYTGSQPLQWESTDFVRIYSRLDAGGWVLIGQFTGSGSNPTVATYLRQDVLRDGVSSNDPSSLDLTATMQDFTFGITGSGSQLDVMVELDYTGGSEELAFDNIRVVGNSAVTAAPTLTSVETTAITYNEGDPSVQVSNQLVVDDTDSPNLTGATAFFQGGYVSGQDELSFTPQGGITGSFNAGTGILTLSGSASKANYQAALRTVRYRNPETVNATGGTRFVAFTATDGTNTGVSAARTINFNAQLNSPAALTYTEDFDSNGEGTRYSSNSFAVPSPCSGFLRTTTNPYTCASTTFGNVSNSGYWYAEATSSTVNPAAIDIGTLILAPVNATNYNNLHFNVRLGVGLLTQWEKEDFVKFYYRVNGGSWVLFGAFYGNNPGNGVAGELARDTDLNGVADGVTLNTSLQNIDFALPPAVTGASVDFMIEVDNDGGEELAMDRIQISGTLNNPPVANNDVATVAEDASSTVINVLGNDNTDAGETLTVTGVTQPSNGTVTLTSGVVRFTPNANFNGSTSFTYTVSDGSLTATATVTVTVTPVNDPPVANDDVATVAEDAAATVINVLGNDNTGVDTGETLTVTGVTQPGNGTVTLTSGVVRFTPNANYNGSTSFTYTIADGNGGTASATVTVTVTPVNDPPVANNDGATVAEDAGPTVINVLGNDNTGPDTGETLTVTGVTQPSNGSVTLTSGVVRFTPNANYNGSTTFTYTIADGNGGTASATVTVTVTPVNDPPVANDDLATVAEDAAATVINVLGNDNTGPDTGETLTVTGVTQPSNGTVTLISGVVRFTPNANFNGSTTFTYTIADGNGGTASATVTMTVTPVNDPPSISPQTFSIAENSANGTVVGAVVANDPDGTTPTYSITNGNTGGAFTFVGNSLRVASSAALDFETTPSFSLTVEVTDGSLTDNATVTVNLTDVAESPTGVGLSPQSIQENQPSGTAVGNLSTTGPGNGYTYSLVSGAGSTGNGSFQIVGSQLRTAVVFDAEAQNSYDIRIRSTDNANAASFVEQTFNITILNVNEAPSINPQTFSIAENSANGTVVGTVVANDPDGTTPTYSITNGNTGGAFTFVGNSLRVANPTALNFEATPSFSLTVQVTDGSLTDNATVTVNLTNVNEAPSISPQTFSIAENSANGSVVGAVVASDPDGTTPTYSITNGNTGGAFTFVGNSLRVASPAALNFETTPSFSLTVQVTDGSLTDNATVTVNLTNVNEAPSISPQTFSIAENSANGTVVGSVTASDPDGTTPTYSITNGNTGGAFTFVGNSLEVANPAALDFETTPSFSLTVQVTDGSLTDNATVTVNLSNVNETPTALALDNASVAENQPAGTAVGDLSTTDPDAGQGFTYSLVSGAGSTGNGSFQIVGSQLRTATALDFENQNSYSVRVRTTDNGSPTRFLEDVFVISVTNVTETPTITTVTPGTGFVGSSVTVNGSRLSGATAVSFNGTPATVFSVNPAGTQLTVVVPAGATTGTISVTVPDGSVTSVANFTVLSAFTWTGDVSTDWTDADNWQGNLVPTATGAALLPAGRPRYPILVASQSVGALTISTGASLALNAGTLTLNGNFSNGGTFTHNGGDVSLAGAGVKQVGGESTTTFRELTVGTSGATLTDPVRISRMLTLTGNLNSGGNLLLLSSATATAMVVNNGGTVSGPATVQRWIDGSLNASYGYRHLSAPVTNTTFADLAATGFVPTVNPAYNTAPNPINVRPYPNIFGFDESRFPASPDFTKGYFSPTTTADPMTSGRGWSVYFPGNRAVDFVGTLGTGTVTRGGLTHTGSFNGIEDKSGWHLLGNPYPSPIDWDLVTVPAGMSSAVSVWKSTATGNAGTYTVYTNGVGPAGADLIAMGQGFFARVTGAGPVSFSFTNACRVTDYANPIVGRPIAGTPQLTPRPLVGLSVRAAQASAEQTDETFVYFEDGATGDVDNRFDGVKPQHATGMPTLVSVAYGTELGVNGLPTTLLATGTTVPLLVAVPAAGRYVLDVTRLENLTGSAVTLVDHLTNTRYNLAGQSTVSFTTTQAGTLPTRFELVFGQRVTGLVADAALTVALFPNPAREQVKLVLNQALATAGRVEVLDGVGRVVLTQALAVGATEAQLNVQTLPTGVYVVRCGAASHRLVIE